MPPWVSVLGVEVAWTAASHTPGTGSFRSQAGGGFASLSLGLAVFKSEIVNNPLHRVPVVTSTGHLLSARRHAGVSRGRGPGFRGAFGSKSYCRKEVIESG